MSNSSCKNKLHLFQYIAYCVIFCRELLRIQRVVDFQVQLVIISMWGLPVVQIEIRGSSVVKRPVQHRLSNCVKIRYNF